MANLDSLKKTLWIVSNTDTMAGCYSDAMTCGSLDDAATFAIALLEAGNGDGKSFVAIKIEDGVPSIVTDEVKEAAATLYLKNEPDYDMLLKWVSNTNAGMDYVDDAEESIADFAAYQRDVSKTFHQSIA